MSEKTDKTPKKIVSKDAIFGKTGEAARIYTNVEVEEWGGYVRIRSLTGAERDNFESSLTEGRGKNQKSNTENFRARLIALCMVDQDGNLLLTNRYEIAKLGEAPVSAIQKVFNACQAMNGFSDEDVADLTEDFEEGPDDSSTSD